LSGVWIENPTYFITVCTAKRRKILETPKCAEILIESWHSAAAKHGWVVGRFVIMPDHAHFFARPQPGAKTLSAFMCDWKKWTSRLLVRAAGASPPVWQLEFFDHVLRSPDSYAAKWRYVCENPVRAGLAASPEAWPYSGVCEDLFF